MEQKRSDIKGKKITKRNEINTKSENENNQDTETFNKIENEENTTSRRAKIRKREKSKEKKELKPTISKWLNNIATVLLFTLLAFVLFFVVISKASGGSPQIFGYQLKTVLSGSMEPGIKTGSIIAVKPGGDMTRFKEDDVITFMDEEKRLVTHRVVEVVESGENIMYKTKGDNNDAPDTDLVLSDNVVAKYTGFTIPYVGYFINFAQSQNGAFLMLLPGILLLIYAGFTFWKVLKNVDIENTDDKEKANQGSGDIKQSEA
jgi:signal peptidase I